VEVLQGDASKAKSMLGWAPTRSFEQVVHEMVDEDVRRLQESGSPKRSA
jgi:GDPmannose 4,6-dehydratase